MVLQDMNERNLEHKGLREAELRHRLEMVLREEEVRPADLAGVTLWAVNALHGIRGVTEWHDGPTLSADDDRLEAWQKSYWSRATTVRAGA
jgi:hypothetical protein